MRFKKDLPPLWLKVWWVRHKMDVLILVTYVLLLAIGVATWMWFNKGYIVRGRKEEEVIRQEYEQLKDDFDRKTEKLKKYEKKEQHEEKERERLFSYCYRFQGHQRETCKEVVRSGLEVQRLSKIGGLADFSVAVATNESLFKKRYCPDFNPYGIGAYDSKHWTKFKSYRQATVKLAKLLIDKGYRKITNEAVTSIGSWYAANLGWAAKIQWFMSQMKT